MTTRRARAANLFLRRTTRSRIRLASGLILFAFVLTHFLNHALGLVSFDAMTRMEEMRRAVQRSAPGTVILLAAALTHLTLGLWHLLEADSWRMGRRPALQLGTGLLIPILLIAHVMGTRGLHIMTGIDDNYRYILSVLWPNGAIRFGIFMALVWVHSCMGLHRALVRLPTYRRFLWLWYALALLIPVLGFAGFTVAGRVNRYLGPETWIDPVARARTSRMSVEMVQGYETVLVALFLVWGGVLLLNRLGSRIEVRYFRGPTVHAPRGLTLLGISRINRIPHASVCGGRARCSTCRVRVLAGAENIPPPAQREAQVLRRIGAPANVRLACQVRPQGPVEVSLLLPAGITEGTDGTPDRYLWGVERDVTVMFCDLRGFTRMSEGRLPYDVVFVINQFLGRMGEAITDCGGFVDKFMGDGIMAIFAMDTPADAGARQAIRAARAMGGVLDSLNQSLREALPAPLSMGIGIHSGTAILGRVGAVQDKDAGEARITALGETVNIASRLEGKAKDLGVQVVLSEATAQLAGLDVAGLEREEHEVRGLRREVALFAARRATELPEPERGINTPVADPSGQMPAR